MKLHNLSNKKFGSLTAIRYNGKSRWLCRCDCGNEKIIKAYSLEHGEIKTCGCKNNVKKKEVGKRYGHLVVLREVDKDKNKIDKKKYRGALWECKCDCGNTTIVAGGHLRAGNVKSCGCLYKKEKGEAAINIIYKRTLNNAKSRNLSFEISLKELKEIIFKKCHYCGSPPSMVAGINKGKTYCNGSVKYNGLDRVNNLIGYTKNNIVPCCKICNRAKNNLSYQDFTNWINKIKQHNVRQSYCRRKLV